MPAVSAQKPRLAEIDALRGIAAMAVLLFHYTVIFSRLFPDQAVFGILFETGHHAVLLFFAISGFVIAFSLRATVHALDFVARRAARLFPAYWVAMALTTAAVHFFAVERLQVPAAAIAANAVMLQGFLYLPAVDGIYWTLTIELAFYACMLLLWRLGMLARIERVIALWLALKVIATLLPDFSSRVTMLLVLEFIPFFAIGILAYRIWAGERRWRDQAPCAALVLLAVGLVDSRADLIAAALLMAGFAALIAGRLTVLRARPLLWLGGISYSLYLVHHNIGFVVMLQAGRLGFSPGTAMAIAAGFSIALGALIRHSVEMPAESAISRAWKAHRARQAQRPAYSG